MTKEQSIYCFVYGATSNPISRAQRNIQTRSAQAAVLKEHRISFGQGGAANILPQRGWTVHGVLLECVSQHDLDLLKEIGANYERCEMQVYPYDNQNEPVLANIYVMSKEQQPDIDELPQERYVRIVQEGLKYHGVEDEYIDYQIMNVHYAPYPKEYLQFDNKTTRHELKQMAYSTYLSKSSRKFWFLVGTKVIQIQQAKQNNNPFVQWAKEELVGKSDSTWFMLQLMYDPSLAVCQSPDQVTPDHVQWAEHQLVEKFRESHVPAVAVSVVEGTDPKQRKRLFHGLKRRAFSFRW